MRIQTQTKSRWKWWMLILLMISVYFVWELNGQRILKGKIAKSTFFCGAENFEDGQFITPEKVFRTRCEKTTSTSYSGNSSCKCGEGQRFAMIADLYDLKSFDTLNVSIAAKIGVRTRLKFVLASASKHNLEIDIPATSQWGVYEGQFVIPLINDSEPMKWKIYPLMAMGKGPVYLDDFSIGIKKFENRKEYNFEALPKMELQINSANFQRIKDKRAEAMGKGILFSSQDDMVKANIRADSLTMSCNVRLKGDLLDHLHGEKWSYRVELKNKKAWKQMTKFSVHNSNARSHLAEWVMHQMMRKEGIISPKYDFFRFSVNKKDLGIFAFEHHFENEMLAENNRLVAPIIKHNDDGFWENIHGGLKNYNWVPSAQMELFNKENDNNESFVKLYQHGHNQLYHYLYSGKKAQEVFDLDKMARYYALIEIGHGKHAQLLTNIRFYVNPTSGLLEPVGYDFYSSNLPKITEGWRPIGQWENGKNIRERSNVGSCYLINLFADFSFFELYLSYLDKFTDPDYLDQRFKEMELDIVMRNNYINSDTTYRDYKYDFHEHLKKAVYTRKKLIPMPYVALKSFKDHQNGNVHLQSFHFFPLKVIGYNSSIGKVFLDEPIILDSYSPNASLTTYEVKCKNKPTEIIYQTLGVDSILYHKIGNNFLPKQYDRPIHEFVSISKSKQFQNNSGSFMAIEKNIIIDKHYKVSQGESINFPSGTKVQFIAGGSLFIEGNIIAVGSPNERIVFLGNNSKGAGMVLSNSKGKNEFNYCLFNNLSAYSQGALTLDAALNIDESEVQFENCRWNLTNALVDVKINNSEFTFYNCSFENNAGSAINSFYSVGKINEIDIADYGKDGIKQVGGNISGGEIKISDVMGTAISINDFAYARLEKLKFVGCHNSVQASNHSDIRINGYKGKAKSRDVQVTGDEKPYCKLVILKADEPDNLSYIVSPKSYLNINHSKKRMK